LPILRLQWRAVDGESAHGIVHGERSRQQQIGGGMRREVGIMGVCVSALTESPVGARPISRSS
jgi:hypothetical protein